MNTTTTDHVRVGHRIATIGRITNISHHGHWAILTTEHGEDFLANGAIVNLDRYSAIHLRSA